MNKPEGRFVSPETRYSVGLGPAFAADATLRSAYSAVVAYGYEGWKLRYVARERLLRRSRLGDGDDECEALAPFALLR